MPAACTRCHSAKVKCDKAEGKACSRCIRLGVAHACVRHVSSQGKRIKHDREQSLSADPARPLPGQRPGAIQRGVSNGMRGGGAASGTGGSSADEILAGISACTFTVKAEAPPVAPGHWSDGVVVETSCSGGRTCPFLNLTGMAANQHFGLLWLIRSWVGACGRPRPTLQPPVQLCVGGLFHRLRDLRTHFSGPLVTGVRAAKLQLQAWRHGASAAWLPGGDCVPAPEFRTAHKCDRAGDHCAALHGSGARGDGQAAAPRGGKPVGLSGSEGTVHGLPAAHLAHARVGTA